MLPSSIAFIIFQLSPFLQRGASSVERLEESQNLPKKLHLVIQTPGGLVHVTTKIANYLRRTFKEVHAFVPYEASSGGTILCLAADNITMGKLANLTPIDPQIPYKDTWISTASYQWAVKTFEERFGKKRPGEIPPPYQQMAEKIDAVMLCEMNKTWQDTANVAISLLQKSYKPKTKEDEDAIDSTAFALTYSARPHVHMIDSHEAERIGLRIERTAENEKLLTTYKKWVKSMLNEEQVKHVIRHYCPTNTKGVSDAAKSTPVKPKKVADGSVDTSERKA